MKILWTLWVRLKAHFWGDGGGWDFFLWLSGWWGRKAGK